MKTTRCWLSVIGCRLWVIKYKPTKNRQPTTNDLKRTNKQFTSILKMTKIQNYIFLAGAIMMVIGVGCKIFGFFPEIMTIIFVLGCISFALIQMSQTYDGNNFTIRRLRKIMIFGDVCFIISGLLMLEDTFHLIFPYMATSIEGYNNYVHYVHHNWVVALLVGAILELYSTHRMSYEFRKEERNN